MTDIEIDIVAALIRAQATCLACGRPWGGLHLCGACAPVSEPAPVQTGLQRSKPP